MPADETEAALLGVEADAGAEDGFEPRSICFFNGDPEGDLAEAADAAVLDVGEDAFEYKLWFNMDAVLVRALYGVAEEEEGAFCGRGVGLGVLDEADGLDARAARVDAAACDAGLCWR